MRHTMIPCLALLLLTACHPETAMNQERAAAEADVTQGGRGLAKLNPSPRKAYELVLRLKDAPGDFAVVEGVAQYDVSNEDQCGHIEPATGTAARITSQEPVELRKVADGEYRGTVYIDRMLDEDYYGRGVCKWEFTGAGAMLKATLFSVTAAGTSRRGTMSPTEDCQAGLLSAVPQPIRKVKLSSSQGVIRPSQAQAARPTETVSMKPCAVSMIRRRS